MESLKPLIALLAIINPIGAVPFFIHFTQNLNRAQRRRTIQVSSFSAFMVIAVSALAGPDRAVAELGPMSTPRRDWPGSIGMPTTVRVFVIWVSRLAHPLGHDERSEACSDPRAS